MDGWAAAVILGKGKMMNVKTTAQGERGVEGNTDGSGEKENVKGWVRHGLVHGKVSLESLGNGDGFTSASSCSGRLQRDTCTSQHRGGASGRAAFCQDLLTVHGQLSPLCRIVVLVAIS